MLLPRMAPVSRRTVKKRRLFKSWPLSAVRRTSIITWIIPTQPNRAYMPHNRRPTRPPIARWAHPEDRTRIRGKWCDLPGPNRTPRNTPTSQTTCTRCPNTKWDWVKPEWLVPLGGNTQVIRGCTDTDRCPGTGNKPWRRLTDTNRNKNNNFLHRSIP